LVGWYVVFVTASDDLLVNGDENWH